MALPPDVALPTDVSRALGEAGVAVAWLFGSRARGDHRDDSDADVAFLLRPGAGTLGLHGQSRLAELLRKALGVPATDVVVLDRAPLELQARVVMEGRVIHSSDEPHRVAFVVGVQGRWGDVAPALAMMDRAYLRRIATTGFGRADGDG